MSKVLEGLKSSVTLDSYLSLYCSTHPLCEEHDLCVRVGQFPFIYATSGDEVNKYDKQFIFVAATVPTHGAQERYWHGSSARARTSLKRRSTSH